MSFLIGLCFLGCRNAGEPTSGARQNVLLVTIDTLRADRLGAYGYGPARTDNLDALARDGVLFERATAQVPVTLPSHASLLTGLFPPIHGVRDNTHFRLDEKAVTLAEILKAQGYQTAAFVGAFVLDESFGLAQGFDVYDDVVGGRDGATPGTIAERPAAEIVRAFGSWLDGTSRETPFFAWLHFFDPHLPYAPPAPHSPTYDGEIAYSDEQFGLVLDKLEAAGLADETQVLVTSDHGESLGEHGEKSHGFFVYDATLRVPWILKGPRLPQGLRVTSSVRTVDVLPTVLELVGVPVPPEIQGESVLELFEASADRVDYAECYVPQLNFHWAPLVAIRADGFKYIDAPRPELYDLNRDPAELHNLFAEEPSRAERMRRELADLVARWPVSLSSRQQPDLETVERLRALGYVGASRASIEPGAALADPKDRLHLWMRIEEVLLQKAAGELDRAAAGAQAVLAEDSMNLLALELLAAIRLDEGKLGEALAIYERILSLDDTRPLSYVQYGNLLWRAGDLEKAESSFRAALEHDPGYMSARLRLSELLVERGRNDEAQTILDGALELRANDPRLRLVRARALRGTGEGTRALVELQELAREHPEDAEIIAEYAGTLAQGGRLDEALAVLKNGPDHHDVHYTLSVLYRSAGNMDAALAEVDRALALEPDSAVALHDRGVLLSRMERLSEAVVTLENAIDVRDTPATRNALGTALCRMDRCSEGVAHFEKAVAEAPSFLEALENLAMAYHVVGREADAARIERQVESRKAQRR